MIHVPIKYITLDSYAGPSAALEPAHEGDAGVDLHAAEDATLFPGERLVISTGIKLAIPEGYEVQIRPRSGMAAKQGFTVLNSPGTIDSGFRGEIKVIGFNSTPAVPRSLMDSIIGVLDGRLEVNDLSEQHDLHVTQGVVRIKRGDRIAQMVVAQYGTCRPEWSFELGDSDRGTSGLGSTGR